MEQSHRRRSPIRFALSTTFDAERDQALQCPVIGMYTLDLAAANKGKVLEPVRLRLSADKRSLVIDRYTRSLPPTRVPVDGGTVDVDTRIGTEAKCVRLGAQDEQPTPAGIGGRPRRSIRRKPRRATSPLHATRDSLSRVIGRSRTRLPVA